MGALESAILLYRGELWSQTGRVQQMSVAKQWSASALHAEDPAVAALAKRFRALAVRGFNKLDGEKPVREDSGASTLTFSDDLLRVLAGGLAALLFLDVMCGQHHSASQNIGQQWKCHYGQPNVMIGEVRGIGGIPMACGWQ